MAVALELEAGPPRRVWVPDAPGAALAVLRALGLDLAAVVPPGALAAMVGMRGYPGAAPGCESDVDLARGHLRLVQRGPPAAIQRRVAHELGHAVLYWAGVPAPHDEDMADAIGWHLWVRARGVRRVLALGGWSVQQALRLMADQVPARVLLHRVTEETRGIVIVRLGGRRWVFAPPEFEVPLRPRRWERELFVRLGDREAYRPGVSSITVQRFRDPASGRAGVALVVPPDAVEFVSERPWEWA